MMWRNAKRVKQDAVPVAVTAFGAADTQALIRSD